MEASSLLNNATPQHKSPTSIPESNDNQITSSSPSTTNTANTTNIATAAENVDDSSTQQFVTISNDGDEKSSSRVFIQVDDQQFRSDNQHDSSIKLKRCKHGRIIIKDLSKRKLAQQSDHGASTVTSKQSNESNNNHIIGGGVPTNDNGTENELNQSSNSERLKPLGTEFNHDSKEPKLIHSQSEPQPHTPPNKSNEQSPDIKPGNQISPSHNTVIRGSSGHRLVLRARARSQSSNESLSPSRVFKSTKSPPRRSRYSRSPKRRERSSSHDRIRGRRRCDSPSPKRRDRSSSSRRKRRQRRKRSPSRRHQRTPDRQRRSDIRRSRRDSPTRRSPNCKLPRSRSATPHRSLSTGRRRDRRDDSQSVSKESSRYERYSQIGHERSRDKFDKEPTPLRSQDDHGLRAGAIDSAASENYISANQHNHDNHSATKRNVAQSSTKSSLAQVISAYQPSSPKFPPEQAQVVEASPGAESPAAPSPATPPSNHGSASSDIYDPEGPIIPISPCDSPPISPVTNIEPSTPKPRSANNEKNGDDDVPSSAVQLNQQEKYMQKLNRQERVIEEVKVALRPFYQNRSISKEQYKDVLRRAVPKICHSKNGEINPIKIRALVDAYVKKMKRH